MEVLTLLFIFLVGFVASFIGTNAGGGGLITVPMLIFLGLPAQMAVATSRFGFLLMPMVGMYAFYKDGKVNARLGLSTAAFSLIGSYVGSRTLLTIPDDILEKVVGVCILLILAFILFRKDVGIRKTEPSKFLKIIGYLSFFFIGFWASFFGGGGAIFANVALMSVFGLTYLEAAGTRKIAVLSTGVMATGVYLYYGVVHFLYGFALLFGAALGSYVGSHYGIKKGDVWVRKLFIAVVAVSALRLLI